MNMSGRKSVWFVVGDKDCCQIRQIRGTISDETPGVFCIREVVTYSMISKRRVVKMEDVGLEPFDYFFDIGGLDEG